MRKSDDKLHLFLLYTMPSSFLPPSSSSSSISISYLLACFNNCFISISYLLACFNNCFCWLASLKKKKKKKAIHSFIHHLPMLLFLLLLLLIPHYLNYNAALLLVVHATRPKPMPVSLEFDPELHITGTAYIFDVYPTTTREPLDDKTRAARVIPGKVEIPARGPVTFTSLQRRVYLIVRLGDTVGTYTMPMTYPSVNGMKFMKFPPGVSIELKIQAAADSPSETRGSYQIAMKYRDQRNTPFESVPSGHFHDLPIASLEAFKQVIASVILDDNFFSRLVSKTPDFLGQLQKMEVGSTASFLESCPLPTTNLQSQQESFQLLYNALKNLPLAPTHQANALVNQQASEIDDTTHPSPNKRKRKHKSTPSTSAPTLLKKLPSDS